MNKFMIFLTGLVFASGTVHAATITPSKGVTIMYINGVKSKDSIGENELYDGFNQVVVRMDKNMSRGSSADVFTSAPYVLELNVNGDEVHIKHPVARSKMEAEKVFKSEKPQWSLTQDGQTLTYEQEKLPGKQGLLPYTGIDELIKQYNSSRGIFFEGGKLIDKPVEAQAIAVATTSSAVVSTASKVEKTSPAKPVASSNVEQLKAWYLKSSKQERKEFRRWMIDQE
ncbi:YccT family protein [Vibrio brasiliensis]